MRASPPHQMLLHGAAAGAAELSVMHKGLKMTRFLATLCMVGMLSMVATQADAGDPFRTTSDSGISNSSLSAMGLGGMRTMTRGESSQIRGQGAIVWGRSFAAASRPNNNTYGVSRNGYRAFGRRAAIGVNASLAHVRGRTAFAGGFSAARSW